MGVRMIELVNSQLQNLTYETFLESIRQSEGRTVVTEVVVSAASLVDKVSNVELAAAFGADMILLNFYDVLQPQIWGLPSVDPTVDTNPHYSFGMGRTIGEVREMIGRPVGINLEPSPVVTEGRRATGENARIAVEQGADFICITGNPKTGVSNEGIVASICDIRQATDGRTPIIAGKMHAAGQIGGGLIDAATVEAFCEAGADIILLPVPGTVPGYTVEIVRELVNVCHSHGKLVMNAIGTSQEGARPDTIRQLALNSKMTGADIQHLGDAGYFGMAQPENILEFCIALKGVRHTYRKMASSLKR
jgi:hypothetical protein